MEENLPYKIKWQRKHREVFKKVHGYSERAFYGTGKLRETILQRDTNKCVKCGMTDEEHKDKWKRPITIDHKDRNRKNNNPDNLQTLCLTCHGSKDISPKLIQKKAELHKSEIISRRKSGETYQNIADRLSLSIATVFKWVKIWEVSYE
uniref:Putative homing endonuclease n=1 Tax=viral metagenome TaxID=1070528 RepID=A0A6H1ZIW5_9ZZZZ